MEIGHFAAYFVAYCRILHIMQCVASPRCRLVEVQENFIKIQEAYELLSDPVKRKQYDSSLDFDETLGFSSCRAPAQRMNDVKDANVANLTYSARCRLFQCIW